MIDPIRSLAVHMLLLSFLTVGGVNTILPELHRQAVEVEGWLTDRQFADLFAIAQAAPGPNMMVVTLIGWTVAGPLGAAVATAALIGPTCALTYAVARLWHRFRNRPWRAAVQRGLLPITVGLVAASALILARSVAVDAATTAIMLATAGISYWTRLNLLWLLIAAALLGMTVLA